MMDRDEYVYDEILKLQTKFDDIQSLKSEFLSMHKRLDKMADILGEMEFGLIQMMKRIERLEDEQTRLT